MPKLEIKTVSKHYGKKKALDGFTFTFTRMWFFVTPVLPGIPRQAYRGILRPLASE